MSTFIVPEINCRHCEKAIKNELAKGDPEIKVEVNIKAKTVKVEKLDDDRVIFLLKEIGYSPQKMK